MMRQSHYFPPTDRFQGGGGVFSRARVLRGTQCSWCLASKFNGSPREETRGKGASGGSEFIRML